MSREGTRCYNRCPCQVGDIVRVNARNFGSSQFRVVSIKAYEQDIQNMVLARIGRESILLTVTPYELELVKPASRDVSSES